MKIVYCRRCANELPDTAPVCSGCGAAQQRPSVAGLTDLAEQSVAGPLESPRAVGRWAGGLGLRLVGLRLVALALALATAAIATTTVAVAGIGIGGRGCVGSCAWSSWSWLQSGH